jgi:inositol-pentakisphosphate 2-kinase
MAPAATGPIETTTTTASTIRSQIQEVPPDIGVSYLAEGGANVVYRIILPENAAPQLRSRFHGKLLRLRKLIGSSMPYVETIRNFDSHIRPLFDSDELVDQELIRLPKQFIAACNAQLERDEASHTRPKSRHGVYLSTKEPFGLLITDMTPEPDSGDCLWEFKPKWLQQSPSAPSDATRCRTCALREMKNHAARLVGGKESRSFCPLELISGNFEDIVHATTFMKGAHGRKRVARFLHQNKTLARLQTLQQQLNAVGLPGLEAPYRERALSMTIRDCTMYVKVSLKRTSALALRLVLSFNQSC